MRKAIILPEDGWVYEILETKTCTAPKGTKWFYEGFRYTVKVIKVPQNN